MGRLHCAIATGTLDVGGGEEVAAFLARRLPEVGLDTVVLHAATRLPGQAGAGGRLARSLVEAGVAVVELSPGTAGEWFARHRPDVVSGHYAPDWMLDAAVAAGVPWVETLHGMNAFLDPHVWSRERRRAAAVSAQIAISDLVRRQYLTGNPDYPEHRIVTIPNGIEEPRYAAVDRSRARVALGLRDEFLFLSLARYCLQKNTYGLVAAFAEVASLHPEAHLLCAGRAADDLLYFEQTRQLARSLPTADRIHLRGHCANAPALLAAADAFVLDSFFEGWSLASMEALASGLPVVMSDVSGAREQLGRDGQRGYLVANPAGPPGSVDWRRIAELRFRPQPNRAELVAAMSALVRDGGTWRARRDRLRREARDLFPADVSLHRHAQVLFAVALGEPTLDLAPVGMR